MPRHKRQEILNNLNESELQILNYAWSFWARDDQWPPKGDWLTWLIMGGRGSGKTRTGAEWVRMRIDALAQQKNNQMKGRIALIGETFSDVRDVMVEGVSGLLSIYPDNMRPRFEPSRKRLLWDNGAIAQMFSAEDPDSLRGPQFDTAWCDEMAKWRYDRETWDMLQFGLRQGQKPQQIVTTTPRPTKLLKQLKEASDTVLSHSTTYDNKANLAPSFIQAIIQKYDKTRLGQQELEGLLIEDREDGLWSRENIEEKRSKEAPHLKRVIISIDPAITAKKTSDACGLIAAGLGSENEAYILEDATIRAVTPQQWARRAIALYEKWQADNIIVEVNQGGDMVATILKQENPHLPIIACHASRGKYVRAEPVSMLYAQKRVHHVGHFPELEDEMCDFGLDGLSNGRSPDRLDALVWALTELMLKPVFTPSIKQL